MWPYRLQFAPRHRYHYNITAYDPMAGEQTAQLQSEKTDCLTTHRSASGSAHIYRSEVHVITTEALCVLPRKLALLRKRITKDGSVGVDGRRGSISVSLVSVAPFKLAGKKAKERVFSACYISYFHIVADEEVHLCAR